ncbi:MAG TPA: peptidoglycan endopeptidase [Deinococcales bacterium]|nr:peptidoglycan endopeptidase [Deinococcales bacterium]
MRLRLVVALTLLGSVAAAAPYTVKKGDTLYSIAQSHGVSLTSVMQANGLSGPTIQPGQKLELPGWNPGKAAPAKAAARAAKPAASVASVSGNALIVRAAYQKLGAAYVWGGNGPWGFDCSGFVRYVYLQRGYDLPRSAQAQFAVGAPVARNQLIPGDLLFFGFRGNITHVGIYAGNNQIIHASTPSTGVIVSNLSESYYVTNWAGARRIIRNH